MCYFNKWFMESMISFREASQFFIHLQAPYKSKKICHFSLKKITKCCIVRFLQLFHFLYILKNIFRNSSSLFFRIFLPHFCNFLKIACHSRFLPPAFLQRKCPEAFLSLRAFRSEYLLQMQQHLCNVEVDQQRGGIHNGGDQG